MKKMLPFLLGLVMATGCQAGWLNPSQPGFVIQTFTSYQPISGNNSGLILTNGNSYQVAGDNTGTIYIGGPGAQFRGKNDGNLLVDGAGAFVLGSFPSLTTVTNRGVGALLLGNLSAGQKALITDVGSASLLLGAGTVSNSQAIVVGDGNASHGSRSVTAGSFWATGSGFHGDASGLTNLPIPGGITLSNDVNSGASLILGNGRPAGMIISSTTDWTNPDSAALQIAGKDLYIWPGHDGGSLIFQSNGSNLLEFSDAYGYWDFDSTEIHNAIVRGSTNQFPDIPWSLYGDHGFAALTGAPADNPALAGAIDGALAGTNDTWSKIEVGGLAIGYQNLSKVGDRSLLMGAYGSAMGQWAFGGGYFPVASDNMSFVWEGVGGQYTSHGSGTFNIRAPAIWFGETKAWDSYLGFTMPVPVGNVTGGWTNRVDTKNLTLNGEIVEMKTMTFWAYATSNATAKTMFTVRYLGGTEVYIY